MQIISITIFSAIQFGEVVQLFDSISKSFLAFHDDSKLLVGSGNRCLTATAKSPNDIVLVHSIVGNRPY